MDQQVGRKSYKEMTLAETAQLGVSEGAGTATGFLGAAAVGRFVERAVKKDVTKSSKTSDKLIAGLANNVPKIALWYGLNKYLTGKNPPTGMMGELVTDAKKATAGSVVFDVVVRAGNKGVNTTEAFLGKYRILNALGMPDPVKVEQMEQSIRQEERQQGNSRMQYVQNDLQKAIQDNSFLRNQLDAALTKLKNVPQIQAPQPAQAPINVNVQRINPPMNVQPYVQPVAVAQQAPVVYAQPVHQPAMVAPVQSVPTPPHVAERERKYGFQAGATPPHVAERERKYGFQSAQPVDVPQRQRKYGFMAGETKESDIGAMFGML